MCPIVTERTTRTSEILELLLCCFLTFSWSIYTQHLPKLKVQSIAIEGQLSV